MGINKQKQTKINKNVWNYKQKYIKSAFLNFYTARIDACENNFLIFKSFEIYNIINQDL